MKRTNTFVVRPRSAQDRELLYELLDASASLWNEFTYERRQQFWVFRTFIDRLACTAEEFGITVEVHSEAWTSQECPNCGSAEYDVLAHDSDER